MSEEAAQIVTLRDVTPGNFDEVVKLSVRDDQKNFVATNVFSLAEAKVFPELIPLAIYAGEMVVGFCMFCYWKDRKEFWIFRLMVDGKSQGKGYGRAAMRLIVERMRAMPGCEKIMISYEPHNAGAKTLYTSLGFQVTGEIMGGEEVSCLAL